MRAVVSSIVFLLSAFIATAQENPTERGDAAMNAGKFDEAVAGHGEAIARGTQKPAHYIDRWAAYDLLGDLDKALADADKAIQLDPKSAEAYDVRGWAKYSKRPNAEAIADLTRDYSDACTTRGRILYYPGEYRKAVVDLSTAIGFDPKQTRAPAERAEYWDTRAAVCAELGRFDQAVKWQKQYLSQKRLTAERRKDGEERLKLYQQHQPYRQKPTG